MLDPRVSSTLPTRWPGERSARLIYSDVILWYAKETQLSVFCLKWASQKFSERPQTRVCVKNKATFLKEQNLPLFVSPAPSTYCMAGNVRRRDNVRAAVRDERARNLHSSYEMIQIFRNRLPNVAASSQHGNGTTRFASSNG